MNAKDTALSSKISDLEKKIDRLNNQTENSPIICPSGWINENGIGCFYFETTKMSWQAARNDCKSRNARADLAEIHNAETHNYLLNIVKKKSPSQWYIGGSDKAKVMTT